MITIDRGNGIENYDESLLRKVEGSVDNDVEKTAWVEYWMDGIEVPVHRSVHVHLKQGLGVEGVLGSFT